MRSGFFLLVLMAPLIYIGWSLLHPFADAGIVFYPLLIIYFLLVGFVLYLPLSFRLARRSGKHSVHPVVSWITFFAMGFLSFSLTFCFFKDMIALILLVPEPATSAALESKLAVYVVVALNLTALTISLYLAQFRIQVERIKIKVVNLPPALVGFKVLQLSDIHLGPTIGPRFMTRIVALAQHLKSKNIIPDLVAVTGDIADALPADVQPALDILDQLPNSRGRFYVFGNHELYWGMPAWVAEMKKRNYRVLNNESETLKISVGTHNAEVSICGVTDTSTEQFSPTMATDASQAISKAPVDAFKILLSHQPHLAVANSALGYDLQLSGHTHGGQFAPWVWAIYFFQPFVKGLYTVGRMQLYVHRGTGTWGPPFRLGAPPELALIELALA